jgi:quercetin dioxygenase-like cupin family protein
MSDYAYIADLLKQIEIPGSGTLSRTVYADDQLKAVLFGFDAGQELSEHTASMPATLHFLQGEARLTLGKDRMDVGAGAWAHMPPHLPHSIYAKTPVVMLLLLFKAAKQGE